MYSPFLPQLKQDLGYTKSKIPILTYNTAMKILNKRAKFDYQLYEKFEAGISLTGDDIKLMRAGQVTLRGAYAKIIDEEAFLITSQLPTRKLLLHKREIEEIMIKTKAKKLTIVPTKLYTKGRLVKVELYLGKAKRKFEKRDTIKKRDLDRELKSSF
jgi:SsrA-binding protein